MAKTNYVLMKTIPIYIFGKDSWVWFIHILQWHSVGV